MKFHDIIKKPARKISRNEFHRRKGEALLHELKENMKHAEFINVKYL